MPVTVSYSFTTLVNNNTIGKINGNNDAVSNIDAVALSDGNIFVTFDADGDIYGEYLDVQGSIQTFPNTVNTTTIPFMQEARSDTLSNGNHVFVFVDNDTDGEPDIRAQIFEPGGNVAVHLGNGSLSINDFVVSSNDSDTQRDPAVLALSGGGFAVAYTEDTNGTNVRVRTFDNDGQVVRSFLPVTNGSTQNTREPEVTQLSDGGIVIAWINVSQFGDRSVFGRILDDPGPSGSLGSTFSITGVGDFDKVSLAPTSSGGFVAAVSADDGGSGAQFLEFSSNGSQVGSAITLGANNNIANAELMEIADDIWLASYDRVFSTTDVDPQTQVIDLSGATPVITSPRTLDFSTQLQEGQALVDVGGNEYISYFENRTSSTATPFLTMESFKIERRIDGDGDANTLNGSTMDDILDGKAAADTMNGDKGNDTYVVDDAADSIVEEASEGDDTVYTTVSYDVPINVEVLIMSGSGNLRSNGTDARDIIIGNVGNNTINGAGGFDVMQGGDGNDSYAVDNSNDAVVETTTGGNDAVDSAVDFSLAQSPNVETLILRRGSETAVQAFGDDTNNQLFGNEFVNNLFGAGGTDFLLGFEGSDNFIITPENGAVDVIGDFDFMGDKDRIGISGFGANAQVVQVSTESFEIRSADGSITQQFILQGYTGGGLVEGTDYFFG